MPIDSVTPPTAKVGEDVVIKGSNFGPGGTRSAVHFNGVLAHPTSWGPNEIKVKIPINATSGPISIAHDGENEEIMYTVEGGGSVATARTEASDDNRDLKKTDQMLTNPGTVGGAPATDEVLPSGVRVHNETGPGGTGLTAEEKAEADKAQADRDKAAGESNVRQTTGQTGSNHPAAQVKADESKKADEKK